MRLWLCGVALLCAWPARAQELTAIAVRPSSNPAIRLGKARFSLPVMDYQALDGSWHVSHGVIVDRQVAPNASLALGLFKAGTKRGTSSSPESNAAGRKLSLRFSYSF